MKRLALVVMLSFGFNCVCVNGAHAMFKGISKIWENVKRECSKTAHDVWREAGRAWEDTKRESTRFAGDVARESTVLAHNAERELKSLPEVLGTIGGAIEMYNQAKDLLRPNTNQ
jgi:hypothetical protein